MHLGIKYGQNWLNILLDFIASVTNSQLREYKVNQNITQPTP